MITVYTRPGCGNCDATKLWLKRNEVPFDEIDVSVDRGAAADVVELGYTSLPVVVDGERHWSGFRIEELAVLKVHHPPINNDVIER